MKLSKRTEYGLRAVVQLARLAPRQYVQSRDLAEQEHLPAKFLESILLTLRRAGLLDSKVGSGGGYRLSRQPQQIIIGDLIRHLEGRLTATDRAPTGPRTPGELAVHLINEKLTAATEDVLSSMTLEQLLEHINGLATQDKAMYYI